MLSNLLTILKTKALVLAVTTALVVGGATAVFAATPSGQNVMHTFAHSNSAGTATAGHKSDSDQDEDKASEENGKNCLGQDDVQELLTRFHLSVKSTSAAQKAICALHTGTFTGTTPAGVPVSSHQKYGAEEIGQLLILAQFLAMKDKVKLSDANASSYLALAVNTCASSASTMGCLKNTIPGFQSGNHDDHSDNDGDGEGSGNNYPTATSTPHD